MKLPNGTNTKDTQSGHQENNIKKHSKLRKVTANNQEIRRKFLTELIQARSDAEARPIKAIIHTEYIIKLHQNFNMA